MKLKYLVFLFAPIFFLSGCGENGENGNDITSVTLSTHWIAMTLSETRTISASTGNGGSFITANIDWASDDPSVATVSSGVISPIGAGTALITASAGGISSIACTVHVAEDWILYSGPDGLRVITPDDTRDMAIPGTPGLAETMAWTTEGIAFDSPGPYTFDYLMFREFDSDTSRMLCADTLNQIYDIREDPNGGILISSFSIYRLPSAVQVPDLSSYLFIEIADVTFQDMDIHPSGDVIVSSVSFGSTARLATFATDGTILDTLTTHGGIDCPRFSPDGTEIAYGYSFATGNLWIMNTDGSGAAIAISEGSYLTGLDWSPDGSKFVMCLRNPAY